jgi:hypothetical protein
LGLFALFVFWGGRLYIEQSYKTLSQSLIVMWGMKHLRWIVGFGGLNRYAKSHGIIGIIGVYAPMSLAILHLIWMFNRPKLSYHTCIAGARRPHLYIDPLVRLS